MYIGDEVYVHGYIDEVRYDETGEISVVIIRNEGGYFGTAESEVYRAIAEQTEPTTEDCSEVEQTEPSVSYSDHTDYKGALDYTDTTDCPWK